MAEKLLQPQFRTHSIPQQRAERTGFFFKPKLKINQPNDAFEKEADNTADRIMRMEDDSMPGYNFNPGNKFLQKKSEEGKLQRKGLSNQTGRQHFGTEAFVPPLSSAGKPLPVSVRNFFEPRFGYDFSSVKIHEDAEAAKSAQSVNALAYTSGKDIVFNENQFEPDTKWGRRLLAHELTHVTQEGGAQIKRGVWIEEGKPDPRAPGAYEDIEGEKVCDPGQVDDQKVQEYIDEAFDFAKVGDGDINLDLAWSHLFQERESHCCDYDLAAAEHYMWARKEVAEGWPALLMLLQIVGYDLVKDLVPQAGECPKTLSNRKVENWGIQGALDGMSDYYTPKPPR